MNYTFPFGEPIMAVKQKADSYDKKYFILGVYASAVHVQWIKDGKVIVKALAVASEPEIFWKGDDNYVQEVINRINLDKSYGELKPASRSLNGPSGNCLDERYLNPLKLTRNDVWLCDLLPESRKNPTQEKALKEHYDGKVFIDYNFPPVPEIIADDNRVCEIVQELEQSGASNIILLGDQPIKFFLNKFDTTYKKLADIEAKNMYGKAFPVTINGNHYSVICLAHPRQTGELGQHSPKWKSVHDKWIEAL